MVSIAPFDKIHLRLASRWRIRHREGKGGGQRCIPRVLFVDWLLSPHLEKLRGSKFNTPEDLDAFSQRFDEGLKRVFSSDRAIQYVKFGSPRDNDHECGIKAGRLALTG